MLEKDKRQEKDTTDHQIDRPTDTETQREIKRDRGRDIVQLPYLQIHRKIVFVIS